MGSGEIWNRGIELHPYLCVTEPLRWAKSDEIVATITQENSIVRLQCKAVGFPSPSYHWYKGDELVEGASSHTIDVVRYGATSSLAEKNPWQLYTALGMQKLVLEISSDIVPDDCEFLELITRDVCGSFQ